MSVSYNLGHIHQWEDWFVAWRAACLLERVP